MMNRVKARLSIEAIRKPYDPGYPARLSDDELTALLKARAGSPHLRAAALIACLGSSLAAQESKPTSRPAGDSNREAKICWSLNAAMAKCRNGYWLPFASIERSEIPGLPGRKVVKAIVPISYGNSFSGLFDANAARQHARMVFGAYGIPLKMEVEVDVRGARGILDGYSEERKLGFEIRTHDLDMEQFVDWSEPVATNENQDVALDEREITAIEATGRKILYAPQSFYAVFDGDKSVPMLYWMAAVVDFLNSVTDGPDVDIAGALTGEFRRKSASTVVDAKTRKNLEPHVERPFDVDAAQDSTTLIVLDESTRIRLLVEQAPGFVPKDKVEERGESSEPPTTTRPSRPPIRPTMISIAYFNGTLRNATRGSTAGQDKFAGRVSGIFQKKPDGTESSWHPEKFEGWTFFIPSTIDVNLPFEIEIELPKGRSAIPNSVYVR